MSFDDLQLELNKKQWLIVLGYGFGLSLVLETLYMSFDIGFLLRAVLTFLYAFGLCFFIMNKQNKNKVKSGSTGQR